MSTQGRSEISNFEVYTAEGRDFVLDGVRKEDIEVALQKTVVRSRERAQSIRQRTTGKRTNRKFLFRDD